MKRKRHPESSERRNAPVELRHHGAYVRQRTSWMQNIYRNWVGKVCIAGTALLAAAGGSLWIMKRNSGNDSASSHLEHRSKFAELFTRVRIGPDRPLTGRELVDLTRELERLGLISRAEWHHPAGSSDENPANPLVVVEFLHPDINGALRTPEHAVGLHRGFWAGAGLHRGGVQNFFMEGAPSDQPLQHALSDGRRLYTPSEIREEVSTLQGLQSALSQGANCSHIFVSGLPGNWRGTENPATYQQFHKEVGANLVDLTLVEEILTRIRKGSQYPHFTIGITPGDIVRFNDDGKGYSRAALLTALHRFVDQHENATYGDGGRSREKHALSLPSGVMFIGNAHMGRMAENGPKNGRSIGLIHVSDGPLQADIRVSNVKAIIRLIEGTPTPMRK